MKLDRGIAVALEYCDPSGLSDEDFEVYESIDFWFTVTDWHEDSYDINGLCDFTHKYSHCVDIEREDIP